MLGEHMFSHYNLLLDDLCPWIKVHTTIAGNPVTKWLLRVFLLNGLGPHKASAEAVFVRYALAIRSCGFLGVLPISSRLTLEVISDSVLEFALLCVSPWTVPSGQTVWAKGHSLLNSWVPKNWRSAIVDLKTMCGSLKCEGAGIV